MSRPLTNKTKLALAVGLAITAALGMLAIWYLIPASKIPEGVMIDRIIVYKSKHQLQAFSHDKLVVTYTVAIGKNATGAKAYEGDQRTPEGLYTINGRNPNSGYHKNLGISYPNDNDRARAKILGKRTGGDVKIHGLKNGRGYIGKFHRFRDWTNGCIALDNDEVDELYNHVAVGTPIEIRK